MDESDIEPQYAYWTVPEEQRQAYNENKVSYLHKLVSVELREDKYNPGKFSVQQLPISEIAF
jgi:DNA-binding SARP family transcriptional activator